MMFFWMFGVPPPITTSGQESATRCQWPPSGTTSRARREGPAAALDLEGQLAELDLEVRADAAC